MKVLRTVLILLVLPATSAAPARAQGGTCGPCPYPGFCSPTLPMGAGPGEDHRCEDWFGASLSGAFLVDADLRGANLAAAKLRAARLDGADLTGAALFAADLVSADLAHADLTDADLAVADLRRADLRGAALSNALLLGADVGGTDFSGADLETAEELDTTWGAALYSGRTSFPADFDPVAAGWYLVGSSACVEDARRSGRSGSSGPAHEVAQDAFGIVRQ